MTILEGSQMQSLLAMLKTTHPLLAVVSMFLAVMLGSPKLSSGDEARDTKEPLTLFDGRSAEAWEFREKAWVVDEDGHLTCQMEEVIQKSGKKKIRGMGYIWTRESFSDFVLDLEYRLSPLANSGVFFRTDPIDPVQSGFEIQLLDDQGVQREGVTPEPKKSNAALYDCQAPTPHLPRANGQWNRLRLTCRGSLVKVEMNNQIVNEIDLQLWDQAGKNPDGTSNKFTKPLNARPKSGRIGFQNHGKQVWFRNIQVAVLAD